MPVLDWTLSRKKKNLSKFYKIDVISMTDEDSFAAAAPERRAYGTLRKIKSLNDLLENDVDDHSNISKTTSGEISKPSVGTETQQLMMRFDEDDDDDEVTPLTSRKPRQSMAGQNGSTEGWVDQLRQRGDKKPTGQFIVSGFSTLSRRAGGGMEVPDINMQAIRVFLRNGTHKTVRTTPNTTCKEVLQGVLKKLGLQGSMYQYGLYIQYAISDGRIAPDDEIIANINPNTWDSVTRIYLCRKEEFSSTNTRSRCVSFVRDFLEIEQNRSDTNFAYDVTEFTNIQKRLQVSTHRGRMATVAVHKPSVKTHMITNKLIVESFADCWAKANRQLNISNDYIESGVKFKTVKVLEANKRKLSVPIGTIGRSYTIERGKESRPALAKMFSTGSLETSTLAVKSSRIAASPLLQNVNVNSNNSNNNIPIPYRAGSLVNLYQNSSTGKCSVHPFARPLEHSSSLPVIKISTIKEEDDEEVYSTLSVSSMSQSDKSELLHKISPFSSYSSLDLHSAPLYRDKAEAPRVDSISCDRSRSPSPQPPGCLLVSSKSLPNFAANEAINTNSDVINTNEQLSLECGINNVSQTNQLLSPKEPVRRRRPPPLPPRKHPPATYHSSTLPMNRPNTPKKPIESTSNEQDLKQEDNETGDSIGQMPKCKSNTKIRRRRSISLSDLRGSLEKKSLKLTSMCNVETLRKAIPGSKLRQLPPLKLVKQPADYQNVSIKELMAIRAAVTSPTLSSSAGSSVVPMRPKTPDSALKPPAVPKRHSSLFMSSSTSNEEILLQYKRMSSDSLYSCQDIETVIDNPSICDAVVTSGDALADQNTTESAKNQEAIQPGSFRNGCTSACDYDHLDFNRSETISNTAVTPADKQSENSLQDYVVDQSLVADVKVSQDDESSSSSATNWVASSTNSHYDKTVHFGQKERETCNKPYNTLEDVRPSVTSQYNKPRPRTAVLKKPSCSHIYEDVGSDYEDIDDDEDIADDDDEEDYVIMESKKTMPVPPPPPLPPSFPKHPKELRQQQQVTNKATNTTKPSLVVVSSFAEKSKASQAPKSPTEPQIKIMVGKTNKTSQPVSVQDELKDKIQTRNFDKQLQNAPDSCSQHCNTTGKNILTVSRQPDGNRDTVPSELEAKFLALKNSHDSRKEMIERAELKLATSSNTTKRMELHNYANMSKNFMILKEENASEYT